MEKTIVTGVIFSILILPSVSSIAFAQYTTTDGKTGLDSHLKFAKKNNKSTQFLISKILKYFFKQDDM